MDGEQENTARKEKYSWAGPKERDGEKKRSYPQGLAGLVRVLESGSQAKEDVE
jgi:hypothetical protein